MNREVKELAIDLYLKKIKQVDKKAAKQTEKILRPKQA